MWIIWVVIAILALVGEILTTGLFLASLALAALGVAAISLVAPTVVQLITFAILSVVFLGAVRPAVLRLLPSPGTDQEPPQVGPIGQQALAVERIDGRQGMIRIGSGEFWTARPLERGVVIEPGSDVEVVRFEGLTARVQPCHSPAGASQGAAQVDETIADAASAPVSRGKEEVIPFGLTAREVEVLELLALGISNQEIADRLYLSPRTVHHHVSHIFNKMGVGNRVEAVRLAIEHGLVDTSTPPTP